MPDLRSLPSVEQLLQQPALIEWIAAFGLPLTLAAVRSALDEARARFAVDKSLPLDGALLQHIHTRLEAWTAPTSTSARGKDSF